MFRVRIFGGLWNSQNSKETKLISIFMRYILYDKGNTSMGGIAGIGSCIIIPCYYIIINKCSIVINAQLPTSACKFLE